MSTSSSTGSSVSGSVILKVIILLTDLALSCSSKYSISNVASLSTSISLTQLLITCLMAFIIWSASFDSCAISSIFSSFTVKGRYFTFLLVDGMIMSNKGCLILGSGIVYSIKKILRQQSPSLHL